MCPEHAGATAVIGALLYACTPAPWGYGTPGDDDDLNPSDDYHEREGQRTDAIDVARFFRGDAMAACVLYADGSLGCFDDRELEWTLPTTDALQAIVAHSGEDFAVVTAGGDIAQWRFEQQSFTDPVLATLVEVITGPFDTGWGALDTSSAPSRDESSIGYLCAHSIPDAVTCARRNSDTYGPWASFTKVTMHPPNQGYGLNADGDIERFYMTGGPDLFVPFTVEGVRDLDTNGTASCVVGNGRPQCIGLGIVAEPDRVVEARVPRESSYTRVSVAAVTCALSGSGGVTCFGGSRAALATVPDDQFSTVSAGAYGACGVTARGTVKCWGGGYMPLTPP